MLLKTLLYLYIFVMTGIKTHAQNDSIFSGSKIRSIRLINISTGKPDFIYQEKKPCLFIFISPDCPLCQNYSAILNGIQIKYGDKINCFGIIPGKAYSDKTLKIFQSTYQINVPLYIDTHLKLSKYLFASVTPQVILLDQNKQLIYKGAIDDLIQKLGKQKLKATRFYLTDAIENALKNNPVEIKRTTAVGCKINDY